MPSSKDSKWFSTPNAMRKRKRFEVTLPDETLEDLDELAKVYGSRSAAVEEGVRLLKNKRKKPPSVKG